MRLNPGVRTNPNLFSLHGVPLKEVLKRTWAEIRADDVFGRSAQLAYYFFLALFPFLICVIASLSIFGNADRGRALLFSLLASAPHRPSIIGTAAVQRRSISRALR